MASAGNLLLSYIRRVHIENSGICFKFLTLIVLHYYHNPTGNEKSFVYPPFILSGHSDIHKAPSSYMCVFTLITLFALQLLAGHISLAGSEKEEVSKETVHLLLICSNYN